MSLKTDNFKLYKYEDNDIGDLRFINDSMDIIDKGINPFYIATQSSTNTYKVTTGLNKTVLNDGYSIKVAIPKDSTGAVSVTVDSVTVPVKKPNGNAVTNFKQNGVYSLTYYNSVFILASGGGADTVNFTSDKLLTGYSANDSNGEKIDGTMPNNGAKTASLNCGGSYTIPKGYHNGSGKVTANSLASQTSANATAKDIIKGKTAWVNGSKLTGTATIQSLGGKNYKSGTTTGFKTRDTDTGSPNHYPMAYYCIKINVTGFTPKVLVVKDSNGELLALATQGYSFYYFDSPWSSGNYKYGWKEAEPSSLNNTNIYIREIAKFSGSFSDTYNSGETLTWEAWG